MVVSGPNAEAENPSHNVCISYSHEDPDPQWLGRVRAHLHPLEHDGLAVQVWDDSRIQSGKEWQTEIVKALRWSRIALLLISANFFASDFIWIKELAPSAFRSR
jgi:hypothetical protein